MAVNAGWHHLPRGKFERAETRHSVTNMLRSMLGGVNAGWHYLPRGT